MEYRVWSPLTSKTGRVAVAAVDPEKWLATLGFLGLDHSACSCDHHNSHDHDVGVFNNLGSLYVDHYHNDYL